MGSQYSTCGQLSTKYRQHFATKKYIYTSQQSSVQSQLPSALGDNVSSHSSRPCSNPVERVENSTRSKLSPLQPLELKLRTAACDVCFCTSLLPCIIKLYASQYCEFSYSTGPPFSIDTLGSNGLRTTEQHSFRCRMASLRRTDRRQIRHSRHRPRDARTIQRPNIQTELYASASK